MGSDSPRLAPDLVRRRTWASLSPAWDRDQDPLCQRLGVEMVPGGHVPFLFSEAHHQGPGGSRRQPPF